MNINDLTPADEHQIRVAEVLCEQDETSSVVVLDVPNDDGITTQWDVILPVGVTYAVHSHWPEDPSPVELFNRGNLAHTFAEVTPPINGPLYLTGVKGMVARMDASHTIDMRPVPADPRP